MSRCGLVGTPRAMNPELSRRVLPSPSTDRNQGREVAPTKTKRGLLTFDGEKEPPRKPGTANGRKNEGLRRWEPDGRKVEGRPRDRRTGGVKKKERAGLRRKNTKVTSRKARETGRVVKRKGEVRDLKTFTLKTTVRKLRNRLWGPRTGVKRSGTSKTRLDTGSSRFGRTRPRGADRRTFEERSRTTCLGSSAATERLRTELRTRSRRSTRKTKSFDSRPRTRDPGTRDYRNSGTPGDGGDSVWGRPGACVSRRSGTSARASTTSRLRSRATFRSGTTSRGASTRKRRRSGNPTT